MAMLEGAAEVAERFRQAALPLSNQAEEKPDLAITAVFFFN